MVKIKKISKVKYKGNIYDITLKDDTNPYFYANGILSHNSLYPHIMMQCNLFGRQKKLDDRPVWNGADIWKTEGKYYSDNQSGITALLHRWYHDRVNFKKQKDRREYTLKIALNTIYGLSDNPYYSLVYDNIAAGDCTRLGRQFIKYVRKQYRQAGYKVIYTDTDSVFIQDPFKDKEKLLKVKDDCITFIKSTLPFPQETFNIALETEAKYAYFFKGDKEKEADDDMDDDDMFNRSLGLIKKNYIIVSNDDRLIIKNLGLRKKSNSALSKKIFWEYLVPEIKKGTIKFSKTYITNLINKLVEQDITLACMRKEVGSEEQYERCTTSLPAQICKKYKSGIHFLIPNTKGIGVGKGKSFCSVEEFRANRMTFKDIDISNVMAELNYFIKDVPQKDIFSF